MSHIVIVGGGLAAGTAAKTLVDEGFDGEVTIVTEEAHPPYQRPPLSKGYLAGKESLDAVILRPREWYAEHGIDLRTSTRAVSLDPAAHELGLADGTILALRLRSAGDGIVAANPAARRRRPARSRDVAAPGRLRRPRLAAAGRRAAPRAHRVGLDRNGGRRDGPRAGQPRDDSRARPRAARGRPRYARWARSSVAFTRSMASTCARRSTCRRSRAPTEPTGSSSTARPCRPTSC